MDIESLHGPRLVLEDTDPRPLPKMAALAATLHEATRACFDVETTVDQRRALDGADFVIVTISTGGFDSMAAELGCLADSGSANRWATPAASRPLPRRPTCHRPTR